MSLNWNWNEDVGTLEIEQTCDGEKYPFTISLFQGNAMLIMLWRWTEKDGTKMWNMYNFIADKDHLKNLQKNCPEIFDEWRTLTINRAHYNEKYLKILLDALWKTAPHVKIVLQ